MFRIALNANIITGVFLTKERIDKMNDNFVLKVKLKDFTNLEEKDKPFIPKLKKESTYYVLDIITSKRTIKINGIDKIQKDFSYMIVDDYGELKLFASRWFKCSVTPVEINNKHAK
jgi:hypothetical protein